MGILLRLIGAGKSAVSGYGWVLLLVGLLPSAWFAWDNYQTRGDLAECERGRAIEARLALEEAVSEMNRLNEAALRASQTIETIRESGDAFREELAGVELACDLEPVRSGLQQHIDAVRAAREAALAP